MYTMEMTFTAAENPEDIGEVQYQLKKNPDGSVGAPSKEHWNNDLNNKLLNILREFPEVSRIEFSVKDGK